MKEFYLLDDNEYYAGTTLRPDDTTDTDTMVSTPPPTGLHKPKYDRAAEKWVEGMTQEEIDSLPPDKLTLEQRIENMQRALDQMLMGGGANG